MLTLVCLTSTALAQSSTRISFTGYQIKNINDKGWGNFKYFPDQKNASMNISSNPEKKSEYFLVYDNVKSVVKFTVQFDKEKTEEIRKAWNDNSLNCYKSKNGNYIYLKGGSLKALLNESIYFYANKKVRIYYVNTKNKTIMDLIG